MDLRFSANGLGKNLALQIGMQETIQNLNTLYPIFII